MPFETPEAEAVPTRRSSRQRIAASATPVDQVTVGEIPVEPAGERPQTPLSRRAARSHMSRIEPAQAGAESVAAEPVIDLSPMPATSRRAQRAEARGIPIPDVRVEQILAESVVIVSPPTAPVEVPEVAVVEEDQAIPDDLPVAEDPLPAQEPAAGAPSADEDLFATASQIFRAHTGPAPIVPAPTPTSAPVVDAHIAPRRRRPGLRKIVAAGATMGVMGIAGLLAVSMTLPAEAVAAAQGVQATSAMSLVTKDATTAAAAGADATDEEIQAFVASSDVKDADLARSEDYSTVSLVDLAAEQGIQYSDSLYTNDPEAQIQWPFVVGVAMSSGYGQRWGRLHAGIDLVPGNGAPIQVIADGTVRIATESGGAYGVTVYVDHVIDGQVVTSHYAHMQYGSLRVKAGDKVKVGDIVGLVGNTGRSYGAHLHFEIIINGSTVNPLPWMQENAGRHEGVTPVS